MRILLLALLSGCVSTKRQEQSGARSELGAAYLREANAPGAVQVLEESVRLDRRNFEAWERLGLAYMAQGAMERSEEAFERSIRLAPDRAETHNNFGLLLMSLGRNDEAITQFELALTDITYRSPAMVLNNLGHALYLEGRNDEAIARLSDAIRRVPDMCQAYFNRGLVYQALERNQAALADFEEVVRRCPDNAQGSYVRSGLILLSEGDVYAGCSYLRTAVDISPTTRLAERARTNIAEGCSAW